MTKIRILYFIKDAVGGTGTFRVHFIFSGTKIATIDYKKKAR